MAEQKPKLVVRNAAASPVIFFDSVLNWGTREGVAEVELSTRILLPTQGDQAQIELMSVGHLRASLSAMKALRDAIDGALKIAAALEEGLKRPPDYPRDPRQLNG